jgi:hypothetical protein
MVEVEAMATAGTMDLGLQRVAVEPVPASMAMVQVSGLEQIQLHRSQVVVVTAFIGRLLANTTVLAVAVGGLAGSPAITTARVVTVRRTLVVALVEAMRDQVA